MRTLLKINLIVFNLRGNCRTSGELRRKEGDNVFGLGSRTPIAITILVKKTNQTNTAEIFYHDIGDYYKINDKLNILKELGSILNPELKLSSIMPNEDNDWLNQRDGVFCTFVPLEPAKKFAIDSQSFFIINSRGLETARDSWIYNSSIDVLRKNIVSTINFYNNQLGLDLENLSYDSKRISWSGSLISLQQRGVKVKYQEENIISGIYRPFFKQALYHDEYLIHRRGQWDNLFPNPQMENLVICVSGIGVTKDFSCIMVNLIPDLELIGKSQCFPMFWYEKLENKRQGELDFGEGYENAGDYIRHDGISDFILKRCRVLNPKITKEEIFYYVYGILHSPEYRERFSDDLKKTLPHLPIPDEYTTFKAFMHAGRKLADIHLHYESYPLNKDVILTGLDAGYFRVEKMRFVTKDNKRIILYNRSIKVENIPLKAYDYIVNGKSAIEWLMERYAITTDKGSGIVNDPNQWSENPRYILELLLRLIQVSIDTVDIQEKLPKLNL